MNRDLLVRFDLHNDHYVGSVESEPEVSFTDASVSGLFQKFKDYVNDGRSLSQPSHKPGQIS